MFKNIHFIINPAAGRNRPILNTINDVFAPYDLQWDVSITLKEGDGKRHAERILRQGAVDLIVAYGGDGTVMDVANAMVGSKVPFAVLAGGTGNVFAQELGVPMRLRLALEQIASADGTVTSVDAGQVAQQFFLANAVTTFSMFAADRKLKDRWGLLAYFIKVLQALPNLRRTTFRITVDGVQHEAIGVGCIVTNVNKYGVLMTMGPSVKFDDGLLDVFVVDLGIRQMLSLASGVIQLSNFEDTFHHWQGLEIHVESDIPQPVGLDGDPILNKTNEFTVTVSPDAVQVFVPHPQPVIPFMPMFAEAAE